MKHSVVINNSNPRQQIVLARRRQLAIENLECHQERESDLKYIFNNFTIKGNIKYINCSII